MPTRLRLTLELDLADPISGVLTPEGGVGREFVGWLDLLAALEAVGSPGTGAPGQTGSDQLTC